MDLIYKIYSVYLYDNQLNHDYLILDNRRNSYHGLTWDLPYDFTGQSSYGALYKIYNKQISDPVELMRKTSERNGLPFIKNDNFLTINKIEGTHLPNYNAYEIYWNETKSGINITEWEVLHTWNHNSSSYTSYRIWEERGEREKSIRDYNLSLLI